MKRETHHPADEQEWLALRAHDLTSTQVAALFNMSPYTTMYELYHRLINKEVVDEFAGNKFTKWGQRLESAIAHGIAEDQGFEIRPMKEYMRLPEKRLGASFDYSIEDVPSLAAEPWADERKGILEIKNVFGLIFNDQWITDDGKVEAPPHIEIQMQTQLAVSGRQFGYIGALVSGNKVELLKRHRDNEIIEHIYKRAESFWHMVDNKIEPQPDFVKDAEFISKLYGYAEPGKIKDVREDKCISELAYKYKEASVREKAAKSDKKSIKSKMLIKIGAAEKCLGEGFSISSGMIAPTAIEAHQKAGYRMFKVNWKKKKK